MSESGHSDLDFDSYCRRLPFGLLVPGVNNQNCLSITTTAAYSGGVRVCIPLPPGGDTQVNAVIQCDPNPESLPCPISGIDSRLQTSTTDANGAAWCCGDVTGTSPITDPMCIDTAGLSLFALGHAAAPMPVPALGWPAIWLAAGLLAAALGVFMRRGARS